VGGIARGDFALQVWRTDQLSLAKKAVLMAVIAAADAAGEVRAPIRHLATMASLSEIHTSRMLRDLTKMGLLTSLRFERPRGPRPKGGKPPQPRTVGWRVNLDQVVALAAGANVSEAGRRSDPGRHALHRLQLDALETRQLLAAARQRLQDVELALADREVDKDQRRWAELLAQRDRLAEDIIPKLAAHLRLYDVPSAQ
jgi:hypothetical protein